MRPPAGSQGGSNHSSAPRSAASAARRLGAASVARLRVLPRRGCPPFPPFRLQVLELGAGCGLCGIVAARLCASGPVLLTDLAPATMDNLHHNLALNGARAAARTANAPRTPPTALLL